jgi:hypothetical protein
LRISKIPKEEGFGDCGLTPLSEGIRVCIIVNNLMLMDLGKQRVELYSSGAVLPDNERYASDRSSKSNSDKLFGGSGHK